MINIRGILEEVGEGGLAVDGVSIIDILCDLKGEEVDIRIDNVKSTGSI
jgi:hypothetical protein